jgi:hypothetical protein
LLEVAAVPNALADQPVGARNVGEVVELLPLNGAEVEFLDHNGRTRRVAAVKRAHRLL